MTSAILVAVNRGSPLLDASLAEIERPVPVAERDSVKFIAGQEIQDITPRSHLGISTSVLWRWGLLSALTILLEAAIAFLSWRSSGWKQVPVP